MTAARVEAATKPAVPNAPPRVQIESPLTAATFLARAEIPIEVSASDTDGTIKKVYFYADGKLIGFVTRPPYRMVWSRVKVGTYVLTAEAADDRNARSVSNPRTVVVNNQMPTVSLKPFDAYYTLPGTANAIHMTASAADPDGPIVSVEFYAANTLIGVDTSSPFKARWQHVPPGLYEVYAIARDEYGASVTSLPQTVIVVENPQPTQVVFTPSVEHSRVERYELEIFTLFADPETATPVFTLDLGKPEVHGNESRSDVRDMIWMLPKGLYIATVSSLLGDDASRSLPSPPFRRK